MENTKRISAFFSSANGNSVYALVNGTRKMLYNDEHGAYFKASGYKANGGLIDRLTKEETERLNKFLS